MRRNRFVLPVFAWCAAAQIAATEVDAADPEWRMLTAPRFTVLSQRSDSETAAWIREFQQFTETVERLHSFEDRLLPQLTVLMPGDGAVDERLPRGYFGRVPLFALRVAHETWAVAVIPPDVARTDFREMLYRQATLWLARGTRERYPYWYEVGLAGLCSSFNLHDGKAEIACPTDSQQLELQAAALQPLERFFRVTRRDLLDEFDSRTGIFINRREPGRFSSGSSLVFKTDREASFGAQAWLLMHYLTFGPHERKGNALADFLQATREGSPAEAAFRKAFGPETWRVDRELEKYRNQSSFAGWQSPASVGGLKGTIEAASPAIVWTALGRVALSVGDIKLAKSCANEAVRTASDQAEGYELLAYVGTDDDPDAAGVAAERALALGSKDAWTYIIAAERVLRAARSGSMISAGEARAAANCCERAINARPLYRQAYKNLAELIPHLKPPGETDLRFLRAGLQLFPDEITIAAALAATSKHQNDGDAHD